eukprot:COSAG02_NODE_65335_length_258_cov_0.654088_1_plen_60_part_01
MTRQIVQKEFGYQKATKLRGYQTVLWLPMGGRYAPGTEGIGERKPTVHCLKFARVPVARK